MVKEIYFVRHGQSTANTARVISNKVSDYAPLTAQGRQQAEELLNTLQGRGSIAAVFSSPLMRARETAEILALGVGAVLQTVDALREPHCGVLEGRRDDEAWNCHAHQENEWRKGNYDYSVPGGESFRDVEKRFRPFIDSLASKSGASGGSTLIVSHGGVLMNMLPLVLSNVNPDYARANPIGHCDVIVATCDANGLKCVEWCGVMLVPQVGRLIQTD